MSTTIKQSEWFKPARHPSFLHPKLVVNNSLTRKKEEFIPVKGNQISWYICGPTVYDKSHLGHARTYMAFDIIRRILQEYFGYHVLFVMNITDVDDKIIINARQQYLFKQYCVENSSVTPTVLETVQSAWSFFIEKRFTEHGLESIESWTEFIQKPGPDPLQVPKFGMYMKTATSALEAIKTSNTLTSLEFYSAVKDVLSLWLDHQKGHLVTDPKIYRDFAAYWESEFFKDMHLLNVTRPCIVTRVSEYIPEIINYIQVIIDNGFGYMVDDGSVYFDTNRFDAHPDHVYAKLEPWAKGNQKLVQEGEGDLSSTKNGSMKRHASDFALWKASKSGEPAWKSPFGMGRPGWHIECSVMASAVLGSNMDIHSGGIDLAFPHHDNELAQSEAHYKCKQWVNYFLHAGHLHIENLKMSKSLKNFLSIRETLQVTPAPTLRLMFLMHQWDAVLDYSTDSIGEAKGMQNSIENFLSLVKALLQEEEYGTVVEEGFHNYGTNEAQLISLIMEKQELVRSALCDSFNTPSAIMEIKQLIASCNQYYMDKQKQKLRPNSSVLKKAAVYVTKMMRVFGVFMESSASIGSFVVGDSQEKDTSETLMPILKTVSKFRDTVRSLAQQKVDTSQDILRACDVLRDEELIEHGIVLEDRADSGAGALVKLVEKQLLLEQREEKKRKEEAKRLEKEERARVEEEKKRERLERGKVKPEDLFKQSDEYCEWDEKGIPMKDKQGNEVTKSKRKKFEKEFTVQQKLHEEYLKLSNKQ